MKTILLFIIIFIFACDPCAPKRDCKKYETKIILMPMKFGNSTQLHPMTHQECVKWGEVYYSKECKEKREH